ncbi:cyclophilin-like fold protein [Paenarthrobacter sp.]|uniref:cyclophilin-like fold protein n=1 Tax=Paenarthrobacter sp. TaxID=1931993 RepID=UPI002811BAA0|nr:cyclophilin-like fold protein [Paenarthrobacter sp.]
MKRRSSGVLLLALALVSCSPSPTGEATPTSTSETSSPAAGSVMGTVVRFSTGSTSLDVTIGEDNPATRDFLSMLPLTVAVEEFAGREKIADLPRPLHYEGSPGSDPENGDLIYFVPWENLGFYYNASGIGFSDQTIHLGRYNATPEELARFEGQEVRVEVSR